MSDTLCGANSYEEKYYFNEKYNNIPEEVKKELQIACVLFTEEVGGLITIDFSDEGDVLINTTYDEADYLYDEIEAELQVRRLLKEKEELFKSLETYYKVLILKKPITEKIEDKES